jgi:hypothetical protein
LKTKATIMTASVVVAAILVGGNTCAPYAMARSHGFSSINIKSIDVRKSVDTIHQKVVSVKKGGSANGGKGGDSNGASGGTANGGSSGSSTGGAGGPANGGTTGAGGSGGSGGNADAHGGTTTATVALVALAGVALRNHGR